MTFTFGALGAVTLSPARGGLEARKGTFCYAQTPDKQVLKFSRGLAQGMAKEPQDLGWLPRPCCPGRCREGTPRGRAMSWLGRNNTSCTATMVTACTFANCFFFFFMLSLEELQEKVGRFCR